MKGRFPRLWELLQVPYERSSFTASALNKPSSSSSSFPPSSVKRPGERGERNNLIIWNHNNDYRATEEYRNKDYLQELAPPDLR